MKLDGIKRLLVRYPGWVSFEKLLVIMVIAALLIGPERLPGYAASLGRFVRQIKGFTESAKTRLKDEMGEDFDDVDWKQLDPRQYDPRRIIREALADSEPQSTVVSRTVAGTAAAGAVAAGSVAAASETQDGGVKSESAYAQRKRRLEGKEPAPFDSEAT